MIHRFRSAFLATAALVAVSPAAAQTIPQARVDEVRQILEAHPEIVMQAFAKAQEADRQRQAEAAKAAVAPVAASILKGDKQIASVGPAKGEPIIEFFDYNCGFCKRFHTETSTPLMAEGKTRFLLVQTPILGAGSLRLAELSAAANLQGKFEAAHNFLMQHGAHEPADADKLIDELVKVAGLDRTKFDRALADGSARAQVDHNINLARQAGASGTPMLYVRGQAISGAIPLEPLKQILAK